MKLQKVKLQIYDNYLHPVKIHFLREFLLSTQAKALELKNGANPKDGADSEWSEFEKNMEPITQISGLQYFIKWDSKQISNQQ